MRYLTTLCFSIFKWKGWRNPSSVNHPIYCSNISVNSNWVHPWASTGYIPGHQLGNPRGLALKTCQGVGIRLLKVARGPGIRQGPGFCEKRKWNFKKIAWIKFLQKKKQAKFWPFRGLRVFPMESFLVYGSIFWFCCHTYLTKNLRSCPWLVYIWSFHWVMIIHTYFRTKAYDYVKPFVHILVLLVINTRCPKNC